MATLHRVSLLGSLAATVFAAGFGAPVTRADDIEVFFTTSTDATANPNILFILDTSQSMYTVESAAPAAAYDPAATYGSGSCDPTKYYWTTGTTSTPDCGTGWAGLTSTEFDCPTWRGQVDALGVSTKQSRIAQQISSNWVTPTVHPAQAAHPTACQNDTSPSPIANWSKKTKGKDDYPSLSYTFYSGNYLNWAAQGGGDKYRIDLIREAVGEVIASTEGINVGLMRFGYDGARDFRTNTATACEVIPDPDEANRSSNGAPILFPVTDLDAAALTGFQLSKDSYTGETAVRSQIRYQLGLDADNEVIGWVVDPSLDDARPAVPDREGRRWHLPDPALHAGRPFADRRRNE